MRYTLSAALEIAAFIGGVGPKGHDKLPAIRSFL